VILNQEKILRLFDKDLDHPLVDFAMTRLGLDQREAAVALKIDTTQFPITTYLAHRGVARIPLLNKRGMFPGNTMESMAHALWNGFPGFEIDIQVTKDNVLVVSHDGKLGTSTDCKGKISDTLVDDVTKCRVLYTGVVPDLALFHNKAAIPSTIPTLKKVLDTYLPDPRLKHVVLDVKPGNIDVQTPAFAEILHSYPKDQTSKIIFLMRSTTMIHRLQAVEGDTTPIFAREQSKGWEDLEKAAEGKSKEEIFSELNEDEATVTQNENASFDKDDALTTAVDAAADGALNRASDGEPNAVTPAKPPAKVSLSLSLGLGLGLAGLSDHHKGSTLIAIFNILKVVPRVVTRLAQHMFGNGSVEIDLISWSKRNEQALRTLTDAAAQDQRQIVGWTVNSKEKIGWLRANSPKLDFILSDLPYRRIMALQLAELTTALSASALSTTP
jgi:glycerophosphoryl diester phosphodiesterase